MQNIEKYIEEIRQMWLELLELQEVGLDDNFFAMGGTSLSAMLLLNRIETAYDIEIEAEDLADHQTIREVAMVVAEKRAPYDRLFGGE